jgi:hypothetical protein
MKYTRSRDVEWNGTKPLPTEINVMSYDTHAAEMELLSILCRLHGHMTAFDLLTGAEHDSEKDKDISLVLAAFRAYIFPTRPRVMLRDSIKAK